MSITADRVEAVHEALLSGEWRGNAQLKLLQSLAAECEEAGKYTKCPVCRNAGRKSLRPVCEMCGNGGAVRRELAAVYEVVWEGPAHPLDWACNKWGKMAKEEESK